MQSRSLSARARWIAASSAAGMPWGSDGNAQPASGVGAITLPESAPARIVAENNVQHFLSLVNCGQFCPCPSKHVSSQYFWEAQDGRKAHLWLKPTRPPLSISRKRL
jgi:hypothetical protein